MIKPAPPAKPDPKAVYDKALAQYKKDIEKYENDKSEFEKKIKKGQEKVKQLNEQLRPLVLRDFRRELREPASGPRQPHPAERDGRGEEGGARRRRSTAVRRIADEVADGQIAVGPVGARSDRVAPVLVLNQNPQPTANSPAGDFSFERITVGQMSVAPEQLGSLGLDCEQSGSLGLDCDGQAAA